MIITKKKLEQVFNYKTQSKKQAAELKFLINKVQSLNFRKKYQIGFLRDLDSGIDPNTGWVFLRIRGLTLVYEDKQAYKLYDITNNDTLISFPTLLRSYRKKECSGKVAKIVEELAKKTYKVKL